MPETRGLYASVVRLVIQLVVLGILNWLLTELPMVKAISIPGLPFTITSCISLIIGVVMIIILLAFRQDFVPRLRARCADLPFLSIALSDALTLIIIIVAFSSFDGLIRPLLKQYSWTYAIVFLVIALWPIISLISTLYRNAGPLAEWICSKASSISGNSLPSSNCMSCGRPVPPGTDTCSECGVPPTRPAESNITCAACGAINARIAKYCMSCGTSLKEDDQYDTRVSI